MSNLPLQHFNPPKLNIGRQLCELANLLLAQFNIQSLVDYVIQLYSDQINADPKLWLDRTIFSAHEIKSSVNNKAILEQQTEVIEKAISSRKIITTTLGSLPPDPQGFTGLAIPLGHGDQVLGALQLDLRGNRADIDRSVGSAITIASQFSMALNYLQQMTAAQYIRQYIDFSDKIAEIRRSILTNLDRSSLINNLVTLLHQSFGYTQVSLLLQSSNKNEYFSRVGLMADGILENGRIEGIPSNFPVKWSFTNHLPMILNDVQAANDIFDDQGEKSNVKAECVLPLFDGEKPVGGLDICQSSSDSFGPETVNGLFALSQDIETALRNATVYQTEHLRRSVYDRLQKSAGLVTSEDSPNIMAQGLIDELGDFLPCDAATIWVFDVFEGEAGTGQVSPHLHLAAYHISESAKNSSQKLADIDAFDGKYSGVILSEEDLTSTFPWILEIIGSSYPIIRSNYEQAEPVGMQLGFEGDYSAIGGLLSISSRKVGIIIAVNHQVDKYDSESQVILQAFMNSASIVLENLNLYSAAHEQAWISTALLQVAEATQSINEIDRLAEIVTQMMSSLLEVKSCAMYILEPTIERFLYQGSYGFDEEQRARLSEAELFPDTFPAFNELIATLKPVIYSVEDFSLEITHQVFLENDEAADLVILFPMLSQNGLLGAILVDFSGSELTVNSPQNIWDEMYSLVEGIAHQAALSLENIQHLKSQEEETYISIALLQVAQAIVSIGKLDEILSAIVRITPILVGVKRCLIYLWDRKDLVFHRSEYYGFSKPELALLGEVIKSSEFPFIDGVKNEMKILCHALGTENDPNKWSEFLPEDYSVLETITVDTNDDILIEMDNKIIVSSQRLLIGFPLSVKSEFLGVMLVEEEDKRKGTPSIHIREKRIEIVKGITQQAAIAIKNDLLQQEAMKSESMERELQLAKEIQSRFLPNRLPELVGWEINARWQPAHQVGGDFYDLFMLDDEHIGFVMADVADKGMPGALFMTLIRTLLRAAARDQLSPAAVLKQVNELLVPDSKDSMFVTIFYGVLSLDSGKFTYANAGHNPPVIKRADANGLVELPFTSVPLGIFDDYQVEEKEQVLNCGDWIFLYTDGITEAFSAKDEMFGTERMYRLLLSEGYSSSMEFLDRVERAVIEFTSGVEISDDITMAVIYRKV